jgi:hypothetical protein
MHTIILAFVIALSFSKSQRESIANFRAKSRALAMASFCTSTSSGSVNTTTSIVILSLPNSTETVTRRFSPFRDPGTLFGFS